MRTCSAVQQLRDLLGERVVGLVLGGQPDLAGLLEDLLALGVHARRRARRRCPNPAGRVAAFSVSSANSSSNVFTVTHIPVGFLKGSTCR